MQVYVNRALDVQTVAKIRTEYDLSYVPRVTFPLNRTVVNMTNKIAVQLDINCNICEVIVDGSKVELFKSVMYNYIVDFLIDSMKKMMPVKVLNEIGFKLNFYVPQSCDSSLFPNTVKSDILESSTIFSVPLPSPHHKFTLPLKLTDQYTLISPSPIQNFPQQISSQNQTQNQTQPHSQNFAQQPHNQNFAQPQNQMQSQPQNQMQSQPQNPFGNVDGFSFGTPANTNYSFGSQNPTSTFAGYSTPQNNSQFGSFSSASPSSQTSTTPFSGFGAFAMTQTQTQTPSFGNISTPPFTGFGNFK